PGSEPVADADFDGDSDLPVSVDQQIQRVRRIDQYFDEDHFTNGVKAAFPMIVEAFAAGDKDTLRNLLDDGIYQDFAAAIDDRAETGDTLSTEIKDFHDVSILEAKVEKNMLDITVRIISDQVNELTRQQAANDGKGAEPATVEITDIWTFARPVNDANPNWKLIETRIDS
ncbi:MAG: Tim44/TimA family putative adaptor protein, partial [Pseudomonadota bacterium]